MIVKENVELSVQPAPKSMFWLNLFLISSVFYLKLKKYLIGLLLYDEGIQTSLSQKYSPPPPPARLIPPPPHYVSCFPRALTLGLQITRLRH